MVVHDTLSIDLRPLASSSIHSPQPSSSPLSSPDSIPPPSVIPIPANADGGDPYLLASRVMPADHIRDIRKRRDISHNKDIASFYEEQNEEIRRMLSKDDDSDGDADSKRSKTRAKAWAEKVAIQGSLIANIVLSILQLYAAISSGSMSLFATMADSIFDPFSNFILLLAHRTSVKWDVDKYPSGKARMETIGNIVYAFLMATVSVVLIVESIRTMITYSGEEVFHLNIPSVVSVGVAFATKFALFLYCWPLRKGNSQIMMLWEDHRNDLFVNGFGIMTSILGGKLKWWIDPTGAIVISIFILASWSRTAYEQFQLLAGVSASPSVIRFLTYKALTFDETVLQIDTCRAYFSGPKLIVEIDIVMEPSTPLWKAHDVGEALQMALEKLEDVERAYVHVDFETGHKPEHQQQL